MLTSEIEMKGAAGWPMVKQWPDPCAKCAHCLKLISEVGCGLYLGSHCTGVMAGGHPDETTRIPDVYVCRKCQHKANVREAQEVLKVKLCDSCIRKFNYA